jgi:hypothetical protein
MNEQTTFRVSLDTTNKCTTALIVAGWAIDVVVVVVVLRYVANLAGRLPVYLVGGGLASVVLLLIVVGMFAPRAYQVDAYGVTVLRLGSRVYIPANTILDVQPVKIRRVMRVCGCGGFFGAWGWFYARQFGLFRAYVTRRDRLVSLTLKDRKPVVLSPDEPDRFVEAVRAVCSTASVR